MPVTELNHINLRTPYETMLKLKDFYCDVVGLKAGPREGFTSRGFWLYIGDKHVMHLAEYRGEGEPLTNVLTTIDHISFTCTDMPATEAHLKAHNVESVSYTHLAWGKALDLDRWRAESVGVFFHRGGQ